MLHWKSLLAALVACAIAVIPARAQQPTAGNINIGQGAAVPLWKALSGDCTLASSGAITCTKTNGTAFGPFATVTITPTRAGDIVYWNGSAWINLAGNNSGTQGLQETSSGVPSWATFLLASNNLSDVANASTAFANIAPTPTRAGDILYWNGTAWTHLAGNNSGTQVLSENASGVPSWATVAGTGTVTSITASGGLAGGTITTSGTIQTPGGYLNKFRNGTFAVWQRGTSALATSTSGPGSYTADGWQVQQAGAAGTCAQDSGDNGTLFSLKCVGIASNTDTIFGQPIEANDATPLAGATVTVQFAYKQDTGSSVTPKLSTCFASVANNFTTCTSDLASTSLSACASGGWCIESYTLAVSSSASQGYRFNFDCNTALTSAQHCWITAADVRVTPNVSTGVNSNPPPPELRPLGAELRSCERYFQTNYDMGVTPGTSQTSSSPGIQQFSQQQGSSNIPGFVVFRTRMRADPSTPSYWDRAGNASRISQMSASGVSAPTWTDNINPTLTFVSLGQNGFGFYNTSGDVIIGFYWTASAEL